LLQVPVPVPVLKIQVPVQVPVLCMQVQVPVSEDLQKILKIMYSNVDSLLNKKQEL